MSLPLLLLPAHLPFLHGEKPILVSAVVGDQVADGVQVLNHACTHAKLCLLMVAQVV
jgi:hypothetical protein